MFTVDLWFSKCSLGKCSVLPLVVTHYLHYYAKIVINNICQLESNDIFYENGFCEWKSLFNFLS